MTEISRRGVLTGAAAIGVGTALAACGGGGDTDGSASPGSGLTVAKKDVPVGGGSIAVEQQVVVTQPTEGQFKAFSAVCTHQGCLVSSVADNRINCACHNSAFSATDGSVLSPPATRPLEEKTVTVDGDNIKVA